MSILRNNLVCALVWPENIVHLIQGMGNLPVATNLKKTESHCSSSYQLPPFSQLGEELPKSLSTNPGYSVTHSRHTATVSMPLHPLCLIFFSPSLQDASWAFKVWCGLMQAKWELPSEWGLSTWAWACQELQCLSSTRASTPSLGEAEGWQSLTWGSECKCWQCVQKNIHPSFFSLDVYDLKTRRLLPM